VDHIVKSDDRMTVVGVPVSENLGPPYTLSALAYVSAAAVPIAYVLFMRGPRVREKSKYANQPE
jgi:hypothetical protein